jgi:hypothetical protein
VRLSRQGRGRGLREFEAARDQNRCRSLTIDHREYTGIGQYHIQRYTAILNAQIYNPGQDRQNLSIWLAETSVRIGRLRVLYRDVKSLLT